MSADWIDPLADDEAPDPLFAALMVATSTDLDVVAVLTSLARPAWHADAACRGMGPAMFFPERGAPVAPAKAVCAGCPVAGPCAEAGRGEVGIWGGTTAKGRRLIRSRSAPAA